MNTVSDLTIFGAGPYGLSLAAHLHERNIDFRIFGKAMHSWRNSMPKDMLLKSAGFASTLYDPRRAYTLKHYCHDQGLPYQDIDLPVPLATFCDYGLEFQKRYVPELEDDDLTELRCCAEGFELQLKSGRSFKSRNVILGVGIDYFRHVPETLAHLPSQLLTHSAEHRDLDRFRNREVAVIGSGASATDLAILLHETGAIVQLIARKKQLSFGGPWAGTSRSLWRLIRSPISGIGPGWRSCMYARAPWLIRQLPDSLRIRAVSRHLGPAGGWFMKERAEAVQSFMSYELKSATPCGARAQLRLLSNDGTTRVASFDHVIAATGFIPDVKRLPFLGQDILDRLQLIRQSPRLSSTFESSVPGLYFIGPISALTFGPVMRFAVGADFTSRRLSRHLTKKLSGFPHHGMDKKLSATSAH